MTSSPPYWWTKTKDLSLASFLRPPEVVHFSIVIGVSRGWLKTSYGRKIISTSSAILGTWLVPFSCAASFFLELTALANVTSLVCGLRYAYVYVAV